MESIRHSWQAASIHHIPAALADDMRLGLSRSPKVLCSSNFYDERGSGLFQQITELPEYYLTGCETEILRNHARDLLDAVDRESFRLIEVGAGDGHKTEMLLREFARSGAAVEYVPVDICHQSVQELTKKLRAAFSRQHLRVRGIVADYFDAFPLLKRQTELRKLVLFLGSSVGNFDHRQAQRFFKALRRALVPGDLALIGFDLKKDPRILQQAYDDSAGVTREFNLNLLDRINRELGGHFQRDCFQHHAGYNFRLGCMESHLVSIENQLVPIRGLKMVVPFAAWEGMRVERSYKYDFGQIEAFARAARFRVREHFLDHRGYFADSLWEAVR